MESGSRTDKHRIIECYRRPPLHASTKHAILEVCSQYLVSKAWLKIYDEMDDITVYSGLCDIIHDNTLVGTGPYDARTPRSFPERDMSLRAEQDD